MTTSDVKWIDAEDGEGMATIDFVAERDGRRSVTGALWVPDEQVTASLPLVVFGHGASGNRYQEPIPHLAQRFVTEMGCPVLSVDGPVHGLRFVEPGGREALAAEWLRPNATADFLEEWHFAIDLAFSHDGVGHRPVAYFGLSMGAFFGMPMIAARNDVVVSTIGLLGTNGPFAAERELMLQSAANITHPVLYLVQLEDELFDRAGQLEIFDALASTDKRLHANPGLHPDVPHEEMLFAFEFMRGHILGSAPSGTIVPIAN